MEPDFLKMSCFLHPWCSVHYSLCRKVIHGFKYAFLKFTHRGRSGFSTASSVGFLFGWVFFPFFSPQSSLVKNHIPNSAVKAVVTLLLSWLASFVQCISAVKRLASGHKVLERPAGALRGSLLTLIRTLLYIITFTEKSSLVWQLL